MATKVIFVNQSDKKESFKFNLFGEERNRVKVANVLTVFKSSAVILDDGNILEGDEDDLSVDCFEAGKTYTILLRAQESIQDQDQGVLTRVEPSTPKAVGVGTKVVFQEATLDGEISEYEKLRNERVSFNRKRMLELFPSMDPARPVLNIKRQRLQAPVDNHTPHRFNEADSDNEGVVPQAKTKRQLLYLRDEEGPFQVPPPTYERIYGKPPSGTSKDGLYGRAYLRKFFPHQWKLYNMNMSSFRSWMTDKRAAAYLNRNMRYEKSTVEDVKNYLALRAPELAGLTFTEGGTVVTHYMGIDALYRKFKEYKHDNNKHENQVKDENHLVDSQAPIGLEDSRAPIGQEAPTSRVADGYPKIDQELVDTSEVQQTHVNTSEVQQTHVNTSELQKEVLRLRAELKKMQEPCAEETTGTITTEDQLFTPEEIIPRLSLASKNAIAMKVMAVHNGHEVMLGISGMAGMVSKNNRKKKDKKSTPQHQKMDDLDVVVDWALRERVNLVGIEQIMATGGVLRLSTTNIQER